MVLAKSCSDRAGEEWACCLYVKSGDVKIQVVFGLRACSTCAEENFQMPVISVLVLFYTMFVEQIDKISCEIWFTENRLFFSAF